MNILKTNNLEDSAKQYIVENIDTLLHSLIKECDIVSVVKDSPFTPTDNVKKYVMIGAGCGFSWLSGYRKTDKNQKIINAISGLKNEADNLVTKALPEEIRNSLIKSGSLFPLLAQSEAYNQAWCGLKAGWIQIQGVKNVVVNSRQD